MKITLVASTESGLKDEILNHALFMKEYHVGSVRDVKKNRIGVKLTSNNANEEYNDVYRTH